jgi:hypothetical protein
VFLIQGGHHSSTHIAQGIPEGRADGVVWSPADETPDHLAQRVAQAAEHDIVQALDPQLYVAPLEDPNPKRLRDHDLFPIPMRGRAFSAKRMTGMVERVIDYQIGLGLTHLISPTVAVSTVTDRSAQIALNLAETTLELCEERREEAAVTQPLLLSVAIERGVLGDSEAVNSLLDELTSHESPGFYLLFEIDPNLDGTRQSAFLAEALYIVYTLAVTQGKEVWVGYSGLAGYLHRAVGAEAFAAGWFQKQQWWSPAHWSGSGPSGGRPPRNRIFLDTILGSLLVDTELPNIRSQRRDASLGGELLDGAGALVGTYREGGGPATLDRAVCAAQLFEVCMELDGRIGDDLQANLTRVRDDLRAAEEIYQRIDAAGIELEGRSSVTQVRVWVAALEAFIHRAGIEVGE